MSPFAILLCAVAAVLGTLAATPLPPDVRAVTDTGLLAFAAYAVFGLRGDFEAFGQHFAAGEERMVTADRKLLGQSLEHPHAAVTDDRRLAMHGVIEHS